MKASDQAIWVKGEVALHHISDKKTKWGNEHHGSLPTPRFQHASCVANGKLFIIGGTNGSDILNDFHVFNPLTFTWTEYVAHPSRNKVQDGGRARHTVTFMKDLNALFLLVFFDRNFVTAGHGSYTSWIDVQSVRTSAVHLKCTVVYVHPLSRFVA